MLAEMVMADAPFRIDEIGSWPIFVTERLPDRVTIVDDDGIVDFQTSDGLAHIADIPFEREFRRVYTDDDKAVIPVFLSPGPDIGQRMQAIDTIEGPEIDQHHLAAQSLRRQRWRIQPFGTARKARQCAFHRQIDLCPGGDLRDEVDLGRNHRGFREDDVDQCERIDAWRRRQDPVLPTIGAGAWRRRIVMGAVVDAAAPCTPVQVSSVSSIDAVLANEIRERSCASKPAATRTTPARP